MNIDKKIVNASPRNPLYRYFVGEGSGYVQRTTTGGGSSFSDETGVYVDDFANFPATGSEKLLYVDTTTRICYVWDSDTSSYLRATANVQKIVAGSNVSVSPSTGLGEVTVNASIGVSKITAGSNVSISPTGGTGNVTINAASPGVTQITAGSNVSISPTGGTGNVTINAASPGVTQITAGSGISISPTGGTGNVTVSVDVDALKTALGL